MHRNGTTHKISQVRERTSLRAWRSHCGATLQRQLPARRNSPSPRLRTSVEKRFAPPPRMRAVLGTEKRGDFSGNADLDESPLTQRVPIVHGLSRACRAPASEQPGAHCWLRPRPRPRRSRVCQNTSLEPHRRLARGSAYRLHGSAPRFPQSKRRFFKISTARKGSAPALFVTALQAWSL